MRRQRRRLEQINCMLSLCKSAPSVAAAADSRRPAQVSCCWRREALPGCCRPQRVSDNRNNNDATAAGERRASAAKRIDLPWTRIHLTRRGRAPHGTAVWVSNGNSNKCSSPEHSGLRRVAASQSPGQHLFPFPILFWRPPSVHTLTRTIMRPAPLRRRR